MHGLPAFGLPAKWAGPILAASLALAGCSSESMPPIQVTLEPYLEPASTLFGQGQLIVGTGANLGTMSFHPGEIDGFAFEWGVRQKLELNRHKVRAPLEDASSIEYSLSKTLWKEPVPDWSFRSSPQDSAALRMDGDTLRIAGYARPIYIASDPDRAKLEAKGGMYLDLRLRAVPGGMAGDSVRVLRPDSTGRLRPG